MADQRCDAAKEHYKELSGNAEDVCLEDVKAAHEASMVHAKADMKSSKAWADTADDGRKAQSLQ